MGGQPLGREQKFDSPVVAEGLLNGQAGHGGGKVSSNPDVFWWMAPCEKFNTDLRDGLFFEGLLDGHGVVSLRSGQRDFHENFSILLDLFGLRGGSGRFCGGADKTFRPERTEKAGDGDDHDDLLAFIRPFC